MKHELTKTVGTGFGSIVVDHDAITELLESDNYLKIAWAERCGILLADIDNNGVRWAREFIDFYDGYYAGLNKRKQNERPK